MQKMPHLSHIWEPTTVPEVRRARLYPAMKSQPELHQGTSSPHEHSVHPAGATTFSSISW